MPKPLPAAPNLEQLGKQAKELHAAFQTNAPAAVSRCTQHLPQIKADLKLSDAQLVLAREYGFASWPKLKQYVEELVPAEIPQRQQVLDEAMIRAAIKQKDLARAQKFLDAGANINGRLAQVGTTALGWAACGASHLSTMEFLLERGATIDLPANGDFTPLACAAAKGNVAAVQLLLARGAEVNFPQPGNFSVLHGAAYHGDAETVQLVLEAGARVNEQTASGQFGPYWFHLPFCGETPLHNAMAFGSRETIELLLAAGAELDIATRHGETPRQWAGRHQRPKALMKWLLSLG